MQVSLYPLVSKLPSSTNVSDLCVSFEGFKLTAHTVGLEAKVNADAPYFEATMKAQKNTVGVCKTKKTLGIEFGAEAGIDISLDAGLLDKAPIFSAGIWVSLTLYVIPNSNF